MPIYEYRCQRCNSKFEKLVLGAAGPPADGITCPHCGGSQVQFEFSAFAVVGSEGEKSASSRGGSACPSGICGLPPGEEN